MQRLEKLASEGQNIDRRVQIEPLKKELFELKRQQTETLTKNIELMFKFA